MSSDAENCGGQSRSPGVTQGQIRIVCRMEVKLGGWGYRRKCWRLVQGHQGHPRSNLYSLSYGSETWWMGISSDAENVGGQFKVIRVTQGQICIV